MAGIRIFPNIMEEFSTAEEMENFLLKTVGHTGKYYYRSNRSVKKIEKATLGLFRFQDRIIGCAEVIQGPRQVPKNENGVQYPGYLLFDPKSVKIFLPSLPIKDLEAITGDTYHFKENYKTGRGYQIVSNEFRDKILEIATGGSGLTPYEFVALRKWKYGQRGEGTNHKELKDWIASHPEYLGLMIVKEPEVEEHRFVTNDLPDIVFTCSNGVIVSVEIETEFPKSGAFQAIKYKSLLCAEQNLPLDSPKVRSFLVAYSIPEDLKRFCDSYGIETVEKRLTKEGMK